MNKSLKNKIAYFCFLIALSGISFFAFNVNEAKAATLYFSPSSGNYTVGNILSTSVMVNAQGTAINNANAVVNFPTDLLEVISVSQSSSIFSLWVEGPSFSNNAGTVSFNGGLPTPGFSGATGKVISIVFRVKAPGTASVLFSSAAVRANDGLGTNVLTSRAQAQFNLIEIEKEVVPDIPKPEVPKPETPEPIVPSPTTGVPNAPSISSPTHSNTGKWYSNSNPKFTWEVPSGITGARLSFGLLPTSVPNVYYAEPISEKQLEDLTDGIWYFHAQLRNRFGWSETSHFKVQIDTKDPLPFEVTVKEGDETVNPQPTILYETTDENGGIDYYEVRIDQESPIQTNETEYMMPVQSLGKHTVIVRAVDRAGNSTVAVAEIDILPIETPIITEYPDELLPKSILAIKGIAVPEVIVEVYIQENDSEIKIGEAKSDKKGNWVYIDVEPVEKGVYQAWTKAIASSGATSLPSEKITIVVSSPPFLKIGQIAIDYLTTIMTLVILILSIIFVIFWFFLWMKKKKKEVEDGISEAEKELHKAFKFLKEETEKQVATLDKKPGLSAQEKKIRDSLQKALNSSEKLITKKVKSIRTKDVIKKK